MAKIALLIGVSEYKHGLNPLPSAVKDVEAMQRVLVNPEMGNFAEADITVLKNPQPDDIAYAIYHLFADRQKDDLLVFYFSGHGIKDDRGKLYLSSCGTKKQNGKLVTPSAVAASVLHDNINDSRSQRQVIILDCCFSGAVAQGMTVKDDDGSVNVQEQLGGKGRAILTSSTSTQYSFEQEGSELSIYTRYLVEGIEKGAADKDGDGWISVDELHDYASSKVQEASPAITPKFYAVREGYKILLAKSPKDDPKVKYRKEVESRMNRGKFSIPARRLLNSLRLKLKLAPEVAEAIEAEVQQPYQEYQQKLAEYEETLLEAIEAETTLSETTLNDLKDYQQHSGLRDEDVASIEQRVLGLKKAEYQRQQLEQLEKLYEDQGSTQEPLRDEIEISVFYSISLNIVPKVIQVGGETEISIDLKQFEAINENDYMLQIQKSEVIGSELNIILIAPGFLFEGDNITSLPFDSELYSEIYIQQTIQTARFRLTALRPGSATITTELYRGDTFETKLETQIQVADIDEATFIPQRITTQPRPVPQPDFILHVQTIWNETNSTCKFQYQLKSFRFPSIFPGNNIYTSNSLSSSWLEQTQGLLATTLENISGSLPAEGKLRLTFLGKYLFGHVFPIELQSYFRSLIPRLIPQNSTFTPFTLLILADQETWIPWELLYDDQRFLGDRFIISRWLQELNNTIPYEFPVGTVNVAHYANVEQPQLWATLLEAPGAPLPQPLPAGVLHDSTEAMRGLHLIRYSQSSDAANLRNAPVTLDNINDTEDIELQMRPAKLNLRRNRPFVTLSYVKTDTPELTALENTWASAFIRAGCSGFTGSLWAVEPAVEAAFISCFYNRLWAGASLGEAFYTSRKLARAAAPDSLDWLAYVLFGDPMARPYRPVPGDGYAIVEPIGREIDDPLPPGAIARFRVTLRRNPPVWHEDRVIEVAENLIFENLQVHIVTYGLQVIPDLPVTMTLTAKGDYLGWFTLVVPHEITDTSALVQVYFADGMRSIHSLNFSLKIENGREE